MKLIGMLDSPYVRRVAISLQLLDLRFEHQSLSVFRTFEAFKAINPVVKAPTFICDDGTVLIDSTLILQYAEAMAHPRTLMPSAPTVLAQALRTIGLALAACEKSVQIHYERALRPADKVHAPWLERVSGQLIATFDALEESIARVPLDGTRQGISQAGVSTAVAWFFARQMVPDIVAAHVYPTLAAYSEAVEMLDAFRAAPHGDGTFVWRAPSAG
jgi:glutathione S-transferase